jgi:CheY-like chemotaxis protein
MSDKPKLKILAVDDKPFILTLIIASLSPKFDVYTAPGGLSALQWIDEGNYADLITTDIQNPEIDGVEFLRMIRSRADLNTVPVGVLSGLNSSYVTAVSMNCYNSGANFFLKKPFNPDELIALIEVTFRTAGKLPYPTIEL